MCVTEKMFNFVDFLLHSAVFLLIVLYSACVSVISGHVLHETVSWNCTGSLSSSWKASQCCLFQAVPAAINKVASFLLLTYFEDSEDANIDVIISMVLSTNEGQSNLMIGGGGIATNWEFRPPNLPSRGVRGPCLIQCYLGPHKCVSASHHLIPSSGFSRVHQCDRRHTDGWTDHVKVTCRSRQNRFQWCHQNIN